MSDDYLWDRTGKPDPEIETLERSLAPLGHRGEPLVLPETPEAPPEAAPRRAGWIARFLWPHERSALPGDRTVLGVPVRVWAAAPVVVAVAAGAVTPWLVTRRPPGWEVARLEGSPSVGAARIDTKGRLGEGQWLETDASSRAHLTVGRIGEMLIEPNTRLRLVEAGEDRQRLHLALGTVTATILAPPRQFVVETPTARAVDLGCAYTLEVDAVGAALVTVVSGWVAFEDGGREAFIPAGARCATRPGLGPGTPYFTDASHAFKNALTELDLGADEDAGGEAQVGVLERVLAEARREDALTLWHLLARLTGDDRDAVYARLAALVPPPDGVTREGILGGERTMLDRWWDELGFGEMKWWRLWQGSWPVPADSRASPGRAGLRPGKKRRHPVQHAPRGRGQDGSGASRARDPARERRRFMRSTRIAIAAVMLSSLIAGVALAGGRAQVTILDAPKEVVAGRTFEVAFAVVPEWRTAKDRSLEPTLKAVCGDHAITLAAVPLKARGQYKASIALPAAGEWIITVDSRFCETRMKPLVLKAAAAKDATQTRS